ncbi:MAG: response regulator, partial [Methylococcales bacterium]|nr:response regulator [Methylococcales bacterium]
SMLTSLGAEVIYLSRADEVIHQLDTANFDLIVLSCHCFMPDCFEMTKKIRHRFSNETTIPIIATTLNANSIEQQCLQFGINDLLEKPFRRQELSAKIRQWGGIEKPNKTPIIETKMTHDHRDNIAIDSDYIITLKENIGDAFAMVAHEYINSLPMHKSLIEDSFKQLAYQQAADISHKIKGACANMGANKLVTDFKHLQQQAEKHHQPSDQDWKTLEMDIQQAAEILQKKVAS